MSYVTKYIKDDKFSTIIINIIFQYKTNKDEIAYNSMLSTILSNTNYYFKDKALFAKEKLKNFIIDYHASVKSIGKVDFMNFSLLIPNPDVIKEDFVSKAIKLMLDSIYKPNINNGLFDEEIFENVKKSKIEYLLNGYKNINFIAEKNMLDLIDDEGIINKVRYRDLDNYKNIDNEDLVEFYNNIIKNIKPVIFVNGNIKEDLVNTIFNDYFKDMKLNEKKVIEDYNYFYTNKKYKEKYDVSSFYQTILYMVYRIDNYSEKDKYMLFLINLILDSASSNLLIYNLRKKSNLVYTCGSSVFLRNGLLIIKTMSKKSNVKIIQMIVSELIKTLNNMDQYKDNVGNIIYRYSLDLERVKDDPFITKSEVINEYFKSDISMDKEFDILCNIEKEELESVANRLVLDTVYCMEGERE